MRLAAIIRDPTQIIGQSPCKLNEDYLRYFVWMKRLQLLLKRSLSIFPQLEKNERLISRLDLAFPSVN